MSKKANKLETIDVHAYYGTFHALHGISLGIEEKTVTALIGPSGCGKSTFLRLFNRMNDYIEGFRVEGQILLDGRDIYDGEVLVDEVRKEVGMVFQKPNPFPKSIFENVVYGLRLQGIHKRSVLAQEAERALQHAALWEEVKEDLDKSALALSGGQQQRLCIARALAISPSVLLMDEPASALDPISLAKIEALILDLKQHYTIVIVTHNLHQASRVSNATAFFLQGELVEFGPTKAVFTSPKDERTQNYITGRFG